MQAGHQILYLYGGDKPWDSSLWVTSDDRVRGGSSQSHLSVPDSQTARFHGHLDTSTLGGAGFASQYSSSSNSSSANQRGWDLSPYDEGITVAVGRADGKRYALTLKDEVPPRREDGRERSGISWEAEFTAGGGGGGGGEGGKGGGGGGGGGGVAVVHLPWSAFKPTYRGRPRRDARPLDLAGVKRVGLMMRSFFGEQEGDFSIEIHAIAARKRVVDDQATKGEEAAREEDEGDDDGEEEEDDDLKAPVLEKRQGQHRSWMRNLLCGFI